MDIFFETLQFSSQFGVTLTKDAVIAFSRYYDMLENRNRVMNLTAIIDKDSAGILHFLDSLSLFLVSDFKNSSIIDIGSGAGFPGIPIKLTEPSAKVTLLDATGKRVNFMTELCESLGLNDVSCVHSRAEEASRTPDYREIFDIAVSRAVARLNVLCELCLPFVKVGGRFLAMKGPQYSEEVNEASKAIEKLGGEFENTLTYTLPGTDINRAIVIIKKVDSTPEIYPRRFSKMEKSPL